MTGRARGRSRGRGGGNEDAPQPPVGVQPEPYQAPAGRGRSRGSVPLQHAQPPQPAQPQQTAQPQQPAKVPPSDQRQQQMSSLPADMSKLQVRDVPPRDERRRRGFGLEDSHVLKTREEGQLKVGTFGQQVEIVSNFFKVDFRSADLHLYNVVFDPDVQSSKFRHAMLHKIDDVIGSTRCFDGMIMYLPKKLSEPVTKLSVKTNKNEDISITITHRCAVPANSPSVVQLMNILFKKQLKILNMQQIGRHYFNPDRKIDVQVEVERGIATQLQVWPGLQTSILQYEQSVMLCADVTHKVMRRDSVLDFLYNTHRSLSSQGKSNTFYEAAAKSLIGEIVLTRYNNKTYRIDDIDWNKHPTDKFTKADGSEISFQEYYEKTYERKVLDPMQPLLISKPKDKDKKRGTQGPILLLPEFCSIQGLSETMRSNFNVMKDLAQHTRISPEMRAKNLESFMNELQANPEAVQELTRWNMNYEKKLLRMTGRCFPAENMTQKDAKFTYKISDADWTKESRGKMLLSPVSISKWLLVFSQRDSNIAQDFKNTLQKVCGPMGMQVAEPELCRLNQDNAKAFFTALKENITNDLQIVVCIVPNNNKDRYDSIKRLCCVERPIPSQVVVSRTLSKQQMLMSVCTKIGIQLNCKMGGNVWAVDIPIQVMVVGYDVYHDSLTKGKSFGGFVASTNKSLTNYYSRITAHTSHQEICDQLKICMTGALKKYHEINNSLPEKIIVYRDGVGDGQLGMVHGHELPQLKEAFKDVGAGYSPKFAMIVVKKRITTRLFLGNNGQYSNPPPGTVVDTVVTRPEWYDFFLISQSVRQGTVSPTHYNVISDNTGLKPDHFQRLTYKLCHLYYNWPGTIRVPAPCQYAHKLAFLVGQSIHSEPNPVLADRLYYL
uniref:PIWI n=1 Tax=Hydra vulgaris TaxID=6087 RepID=J7HWM3_HYDVU|nr:PIWI [Hydra vulgaris]